MQSLKALKSHQGFMNYFKNTSWLFGEKILRMVVGLFVVIWVARYLGPEQFGLFSYAQSFVGLFTAIATLGLDGIVVRELVKDESRRDELMGTAFWLKILGALGVLIVLAIAVNFTSNDSYTNSLVFIIASATIFQSFNVVDIYFQSKVLSKYVVYANVIGLFISSVVKIALILNEAPLITFAWVILFDSFILASGFIYFYLKNRRHSEQSDRHSVPDTESSFAWKFNKSSALSLLKDSWPLIISGIVISIYMKIDQVMIKEMMGAEAVGQYAAAVRISEAWYFIPMVIASSIFPAIINAKKQSEELYYTRLQKLYDLMVWLAIAIALPMTFLSDWVVNILYGNSYQEAGSVLMIHVWAGIFVFLGVAFSKYLIAENLPKKLFYRTLLGAILNVILNYILIPKFGIKGAAIATLLGQFSANYVYDFFDKDLHHQLKMKTRCFFPLHILKGYK
jgi:O-antigen/teichoic acid export membrane protein